MARLFADENFPFPTVVALRQLGHDVVTAAEAGRSSRSIPDEEVLAFAHAQKRAVLTHNRRHFRHLHQAGQPHSGLVLCTEDPDFTALAKRIDAALANEDDLVGRLLRVNRPQT